MNFNAALKILNQTLKEKQPEKFSSSWIFIELPCVYQFIAKNFRTENDDIDWDRITVKFSRKFQKRWIRYRRRQVRLYENQDEVDLVLKKHASKLYLLLTPTNKKEEVVQNKMFIALVRLSQKGNVLAQQEIIKWAEFIVTDWIERHWQVYKWKGYTDDIEEKIRGCIRCYRYTGTFLGYLFKTLEYSSRGLAPMCKYSLDDPVFDGKETKENFVIHDQQTVL